MSTSWPLVASLTAAAAVTACSARIAPDASPESLAAMLANPQSRDRAACALFERGVYRSTHSYSEEPCKTVAGAVNHVIVAPQSTGPPFYLVFRMWPFPSDQIGPGRSKGPFAIVDGHGRLVPVFAAANMLDDDDDVFAYAGTDAMAVAHVVAYGGREDDNWTLEILHIVPVDASQQPVLSVVLGPSFGPDDACLGSYWTWRHRDIDGDRVPEVEIGPRQQPPVDLLPRAVYRWSRERQAYEGPDGAVESGFLRLHAADASADSRCGCGGYWKAAEAFVQQRRTFGGDPDAVRKRRCTTWEFDQAAR